MIKSVQVLSVVAFVTLPLTVVILLGRGDRREEIRLPSDTHAAFTEEMKGHMVSLQDLTRAMATGNYREAARVAEERVEFGHFIGTTKSQTGPSKARADPFRSGVEVGRDGGQVGPDETAPEGAVAIPVEFRSLGQNLKEAAHRFSLLAQTVERPVEPQASAALNHAYQDLVAACQACHNQYRIPRDDR